MEDNGVVNLTVLAPKDWDIFDIWKSCLDNFGHTILLALKGPNDMLELFVIVGLNV